MATMNNKKTVIKITLLVILILGLFSLAAGCHSADSGTPYFPVARVETGMEALATGTLILEDGYLRLETKGSNDLIIWPKGYSMEIEGDEIMILDEEKQFVARVGDTISAGGGEMENIFNLWLIGVFLPFDCEGPYWVSNEITTN